MKGKVELEINSYNEMMDRLRFLEELMTPKKEYWSDNDDVLIIRISKDDLKRAVNIPDGYKFKDTIYDINTQIAVKDDGEI